MICDLFLGTLAPTFATPCPACGCGMQLGRNTGCCPKCFMDAALRNRLILAHSSLDGSLDVGLFYQMGITVKFSEYVQPGHLYSIAVPDFFGMQVPKWAK